MIFKMASFFKLKILGAWNGCLIKCPNWDFLIPLWFQPIYLHFLKKAHHSSEREVAVVHCTCAFVLCSVQYVGAADFVLGDGWNTWVFVTLLQRNRPLVSKTGLFAQSSSLTFMGVSVWLCHSVFSLTPFPGWTIFIFQMVTWLFWGFHLWNSEIQLSLCLYTSVVCRVSALICAYEKKVPFYNFLLN